MARRGRKAKAAAAPYRTSRRVRTVSALRGFASNNRIYEPGYARPIGPRRPRGRRPGTKNAPKVAPVTVVVQETVQTGRRTRVNGRRRSSGGYSSAIGPVRPGRIGRAKARAVNYFSRFKKGNKTMPRGRKSNNGAAHQPSYAQVTSSLSIQVGQTVSEALFALGSVVTDVITASTKSAADDLAFPVAEFAAATVGRYVAQKYWSRKHPGAAAIASSGFSAMNGDRIGTLLRGKLSQYLSPSGPPAGGPSGR